MVKHVVLFRFRKDVDSETRQKVSERFKAEIMALPFKLDFIRSLEVGLNINENETWDICLCGVFDNLDDVRTYSIFPDHQAAAAALKPYLDGRSCVDYECKGSFQRFG